jgi:hypothetical protein
MNKLSTVKMTDSDTSPFRMPRCDDDGFQQVRVVGASGSGSSSISIDQTTPSITNGVVINAGTALIGKVGIDQTTPGTTESVTTKPTGVGLNNSLTRTSDTNAYLAGDVIGPATGSTAIQTLSNIGIAGKLLTIMDVNFMVQVAAIPSGMTSFTLELYNAAPASALGDNAPWTLTSGDWANYLGYIDLGSPAVRGGCLYIQNIGINKTVLLTSSNLYYYLKTNTGYTPTSAGVKLIYVRATSI